MEYLDFHGEIPAGEYGGGRMVIHDRGSYRCEKWRDDEVIVTLSGERTAGRYVLFATGGGGTGWSGAPTRRRRAGRACPSWSARCTPRPPPGCPGTGPTGATSCAGTGSGRWRTSPVAGCGCSPRPTRRSPAGTRGCGSWPRSWPRPRRCWTACWSRIDAAGRVRPVRPASGGRVPAGAQYLLVDLLWLEGVSQRRPAVRPTPGAARRAGVGRYALADSAVVPRRRRRGAAHRAGAGSARGGGEAAGLGLRAGAAQPALAEHRRGPTARSDVYLTHLECPRCGREHAAERVAEPLRVRFPAAGPLRPGGGGEGGQPGAVRAAPGRPVALPGAAAGRRPAARHHVWARAGRRCCAPRRTARRSASRT